MLPKSGEKQLSNDRVQSDIPHRSFTMDYGKQRLNEPSHDTNAPNENLIINSTSLSSTRNNLVNHCVNTSYPVMSPVIDKDDKASYSSQSDSGDSYSHYTPHTEGVSDAQLQHFYKRKKKKKGCETQPLISSCPPFIRTDHSKFESLNNNHVPNHLEQQYNTISCILPNFRDLALSSGLAQTMKHGLLFRSARHFAATPQVIKDVFCDSLNIKTIIDLRDDDLSPSPSENFSRTLLMHVFGLQVPSHSFKSHDSDVMKEIERQSRNNTLYPTLGVSTRYQSYKKLDTVHSPSFYHNPSNVEKGTVPIPSRTKKGQSSSHLTEEERELCNQFLSNIHPLTKHTTLGDRQNKLVYPLNNCHPVSYSNTISEVPSNSHSISSTHNSLQSSPSKQYKTIPISETSSNRRRLSEGHSRPFTLPPDNSNTVATFLPHQVKVIRVYDSKGGSGIARKVSFNSVLAFERQLRKLYIVNVLNTPDVKARVMETITSSYTLPLFMVYRLADKLTGSALAPYYFCKYFVSMHDLLESYIEMLKYCSANFCKVLKLLTLAEPPILFHCTLGKDRTGIVAILILSILGATDEGIVYDYQLTNHAGNAFQSFNYDFIVRQSGLPEPFTQAPPDTCYKTLQFIRRSWGSVDGYLDWIGFDNVWRKELRNKFLSGNNIDSQISNNDETR